MVFGWTRASVVSVFQQLRVGVRVEQLVELLGVVDDHGEQPAVAVGVLIDGLRLVGQRGTGAYTSDAAFTDSTTAQALPASTLSPTFGNST